MYLCTMYIQFNSKKGKNGKIYTSVLLCQKYRQNGEVKTKVISNLSKLPPEIITQLKAATNKTKGKLVDSADIKVDQALDYGYAFIILRLLDKLRISEVLDKAYRGNANLVKLMIVGKILTAGSKLCIFNWIKRNPLLADKLSVKLSELKKVDQLYQELGELSNMQDTVEKKWALYHKPVKEDIYLYDITSTYLEGSKNELAAFGYNRDGKKGKMQITIGLITDSNGFPLMVKVFNGNEVDHKTVESQFLSIRDKFKAKRIILVGDRGMRIRLNLEEMGDNQKQGLYYISALTSNEITALLKDGVIQLSLFSKELVEVEKDGARYILSNNPLLEQEKGAVRERLKRCFEDEIIKLKVAWQKRKNLNEQNKVTLKKEPKKKLVTRFTEKRLDSFKFRATELQKRYKMTKFYGIEINNDSFEINFDLGKYQEHGSLDGKYIIETTVPNECLDKEQARQQYKNLQNVEHAFRDFKSDGIKIRPVYHRNEAQTRGHVLVCMFAFAIIKEMESLIFPWLKLYNKANKCQLSFDDIKDELNNIKLCKIEFGYKMKEFKFPKLNPIQKEIFNILNLKPEEMILE